MSDQLALSGRCLRCGAPLPLLVDLAGAADEAWNALRGMKLALPPKVTGNLALLRTGLACHAGTCQPREAL